METFVFSAIREHIELARRKTEFRRREVAPEAAVKKLLSGNIELSVFSLVYFRLLFTAAMSLALCPFSTKNFCLLKDQLSCSGLFIWRITVFTQYTFDNHPHLSPNVLAYGPINSNAATYGFD